MKTVEDRPGEVLRLERDARGLARLGVGCLAFCVLGVAGAALAYPRFPDAGPLALVVGAIAAVVALVVADRLYFHFTTLETLLASRALGRLVVVRDPLVSRRPAEHAVALSEIDRLVLSSAFRNSPPVLRLRCWLHHARRPPLAVRIQAEKPSREHAAELLTKLARVAGLGAWRVEKNGYREFAVSASRAAGGDDLPLPPEGDVPASVARVLHRFDPASPLPAGLRVLEWNPGHAIRLRQGWSRSRLLTAAALVAPLAAAWPVSHLAGDEERLWSLVASAALVLLALAVWQVYRAQPAAFSLHWRRGRLEARVRRKTSSVALADVHHIALRVESTAGGGGHPIHHREFRPTRYALELAAETAASGTVRLLERVGPGRLDRVREVEHGLRPLSRALAEALGVPDRDQ